MQLAMFSLIRGKLKTNWGIFWPTRSFMIFAILILPFAAFSQSLDTTSDEFIISPITAVIAIIAVIFIVCALLIIRRKNEQLMLMRNTIDEMVDGLEQGFSAFAMDGNKESLNSNGSVLLLGMESGGKTIEQVLSNSPAEQEYISDLISMIFRPDNAMPAQSIFALFPYEITNSNGTTTTLSYKAIRDNNGRVKKIVVMANNLTGEIEARKSLLAEQNKAKIIIKMTQRRKEFVDLIKDFRKFIEFIATSDQYIDLRHLKTHLHNLKGSAGLFSLKKFISTIHNFESELLAPNVDIVKVLKKYTLELNTEFNETMTIAHLLWGQGFEKLGNMRQINAEQLNEFAIKLKKEVKNSKIIEEFLENIVATSIKDIFTDFNGHLSEVAADLGKKIAPLNIKGEDVHVLLESYSDLFGTFNHIFNNIADHAIEIPADRIRMGKSEIGNVQVEIHLNKESDEKTYLCINIEDDGAGINPQKIRDKLQLKNPSGNWADESNEEIIQHIFDFEFSTSSEISQISGRGIGMDAVRDELNKLGGTIYVKSQVNKGTKFIIKVPYVAASS